MSHLLTLQTAGGEVGDRAGGQSTLESRGGQSTRQFLTLVQALYIVYRTIMSHLLTLQAAGGEVGDRAGGQSTLQSTGVHYTPVPHTGPGSVHRGP